MMFNTTRTEKAPMKEALTVPKESLLCTARFGIRNYPYSLHTKSRPLINNEISHG